MYFAYVDLKAGAQIQSVSLYHLLEEDLKVCIFSLIQESCPHFPTADQNCEYEIENRNARSVEDECGKSQTLIQGAALYSGGT